MENQKNPGMSEEAWKKLHKYIFELSIKYALEKRKSNGEIKLYTHKIETDFIKGDKK